MRLYIPFVIAVLLAGSFAVQAGAVETGTGGGEQISVSPAVPVAGEEAFLSVAPISHRAAFYRWVIRGERYNTRKPQIYYTFNRPGEYFVRVIAFDAYDNELGRRAEVVKVISPKRSTQPPIDGKPSQRTQRTSTITSAQVTLNIDCGDTPGVCAVLGATLIAFSFIGFVFVLHSQ